MHSSLPARQPTFMVRSLQLVKVWLNIEEEEEEDTLRTMIVSGWFNGDRWQATYFRVYSRATKTEYFTINDEISGKFGVYLCIK